MSLLNKILTYTTKRKCDTFNPKRWRTLISLLGLLSPLMVSATELANPYVNDFTSAISFLDVYTSNKLVHDSAAGTITIAGVDSDGNQMYIDHNSPEMLNGKTSAKMQPDSEFRNGVVFRFVDINNYSWIGFDIKTRIRIRECVSGTIQDVTVTIPDATNQADVEVEYVGDIYTITVNGVIVYNDSRPYVKNGQTATIVAGKSGFVAWSVTNCIYSELSVDNFTPIVEDVTVANQVRPTDINNQTSTINLYVQTNAELTALTPVFTILPSTATVTPSGVQDFTNPITYHIAVGARTYDWTVKAVSIEATTETIKSDDMTVSLNKNYPMITKYMLTDGKGFLGSREFSHDTVKINQTSYPLESVVFNKIDEKSVEYTLTIKDVVLGSVTNDVIVKYKISVSGTTLTMKITDVQGDAADTGFHIQLEGALLSVDSTMTDAAVATGGKPSVYKNGTLASLGPFSHGDVTYPFVSNSQIAATVFSPTAFFGDQYTVSLTTAGTDKIVSIYDNGY